MLNITEIKTHIATAVRVFQENIPGVEIPKIVVVSSSRRQAVRDRALAECGTVKEDAYGTSGEVIHGPLDTQILVYQSMLKCESQVLHTVWHELGHILFGTEKDYGIDLNLDTPLRSGYALFNEFLAEYVALFLNGNERFGNVYNPNMYLQMAVQGNNVTPYWLSFYYAIMVGDNTVEESRFLEGEQYLTPKAWNNIKYIMNMLFDQTDKEEFWKVDHEFLINLGKAFDNLYHVVFWNQ